MIDYLLTYADEATAAAAPELAAYRAGEAWDTSRVIPGASVYRHLGTEMVADPEGDWPRELRAPLAGWFLVVALPTRDAALETAACVLIADRDAGTVLHTITTAQDLATLRLEPVFAGSAYPFGAPVVG